MIVETTASHVDHTIHEAVTATPWSSNSTTTRSGPGVGTIICLLSRGVEKTDGRPIRRINAGTIIQPDYCDAAQEPATHAINSTRKRSPEDTGVSSGWLKFEELLIFGTYSAKARWGYTGLKLLHLSNTRICRRTLSGVTSAGVPSRIAP